MTLPLLLLLVVGPAAVHAIGASTQDWYENACSSSCKQHQATSYTQGYWNYNYTQGQNGVACGKSGTCSTSNKCGPYCWDEIDQSGVTNFCGGDIQTPIALSKQWATENSSIEFPALLTTRNDQGCDNFNFFADDHAWELSVHDGACTELYANYNGEKYYFHQLHFHFPSEHTFNGFHDAEVHFVHKNVEEDKFFVLGIFLDVAEGVTNHPFMKPLIDIYMDQGATLDATTGLPDLSDSDWAVEFEIEKFKDQNTGRKLNPYRDFLPSSPAFFHYTGSLTTYPCNEGVEWFVYAEPIQIGAWDLGMFKAALNGYTNSILISPGDITDLNDNRPVEPLGNRTLYYSTGVRDEVVSSPSITGLSIAAISIGAVGLAFSLVAFGYVLAGGSKAKVIVNDQCSTAKVIVNDQGSTTKVIVDDQGSTTKVIVDDQGSAANA